MATGLADKTAAPPAIVQLSTARSQARLPLHAPHEQLEVARGDLEVEVELAKVIERRRVDGVVPGIEGLDDPRADTSPPAIVAAQDADEVETGRVFGQDARRRIGRPVIDDQPESGGRALGDD